MSFFLGFRRASSNGTNRAPAGHQNVTYVAASGDVGAWYGPEYPSVSPNVLAVGGTTLTLTSSGTYSSESGWSDSTGGYSGTDSNFAFYEPEPSYQKSTLESVGLSAGARTTPDVAFNADPSSGVSVYDSVAYDGQSGWFQVGGTSAAAPAWAGLVAITDQGLAITGQNSLSTAELLTELYDLPSSDFNDITSGYNGYYATTGYDLVTGLGSPKSAALVAGLLAANGVSESAATDGTGTTSSTSSSSTAASAPKSVKHHAAEHHRAVKRKTHETKARRAVEQAADRANDHGRLIGSDRPDESREWFISADASRNSQPDSSTLEEQPVLAHNRLWQFSELEADDSVEIDASTARAWEEYDEALAQLAGAATDEHCAATGHKASDFPAALGAAAVAGAALRFVFPPGDGQKRRNWWSARFPRARSSAQMSTRGRAQGICGAYGQTADVRTTLECSPIQKTTRTFARL